jgi:hypothetical protein
MRRDTPDIHVNAQVTIEVTPLMTPRVNRPLGEDP